MLQNLTIENFRGFERFALNDLGRVNLLVGTNNSGKTSILEAILFLQADQKLAALHQILSHRSEFSSDEDDTGLEVRRLFTGHRLRIDSHVTIHGSGTSPFGAIARSVSVSVEITRLLLQQAVPGRNLEQWDQPALRDNSWSLVVDEAQGPAHSPRKKNVFLPFQPDGSVSRKELFARIPFAYRSETREFVSFLGAASLSSVRAKNLFDQVVLTDKEDLVVEAMQIIEPKIERIASGAVRPEQNSSPSRTGILLRMAGSDERIPIGSMGDGTWRMLGLALAVVHAQDGTLLIDEVDTGLHYSVMPRMWRFLNECSKRFNVQIFATTHSQDCYQSLAEICREDVIEPSEVTIQRIERGRAEAVAYSEAAIHAAAERDLEVR